jgi:hypothetical protein
MNQHPAKLTAVRTVNGTPVTRSLLAATTRNTSKSQSLSRKRRNALAARFMQASVSRRRDPGGP